MAVHVHRGDLAAGLTFGEAVAVDTETMGLNPHRDRLCLVQLAGGDGDCHIVRLAKGHTEAPRLKALMSDPALTKIFHFARFDLAVLRRFLGVMPAPIYCTKTASRLARTFTDRHGLKELCKDLINVDLAKEQQTSDWGADELTPAQLKYAAADVLYLHALKARLDDMLVREGRRDLAEACFRFLPTRAELDLEGWPQEDIFAH
ncbi:MAG: ribonuclease D [Pseudomonadota bacterium]